MMIHLDSISAIGEDHDLKRLDQYVSYTPEEVSDFLGGLEAAQEQIDESHREQWFDPKAGLELIEKYIDLVKNYHSLSDTTKGQCIPELESYKEVLKILVDENIRWHFSYDL